MVQVGDRVRLAVPDNPRLDGAKASVETVTEWGAHVVTKAAATGRFRAVHEEMVPCATVSRTAQARDQGYTGDACAVCGGLRMRRNGACSCCEDCGASSGCS